MGFIKAAMASSMLLAGNAAATLDPIVMKVRSDLGNVPRPL
jgi:hypothetical protein